MPETASGQPPRFAVGRDYLLSIAGAVALSILLIFLIVSADVYPCRYTDAKTSAYAGYGHHSLSSVLANDFPWVTDEVPHRYTKYGGDGPYVVMAPSWIVGLYIPIILGIFLLVWKAFKWTVSKANPRNGTFG